MQEMAIVVLGALSEEGGVGVGGGAVTGCLSLV